MSTNRKQINEGEREILRSLERVHRNLRKHDVGRRTFIVSEPDVQVRRIREGLGMSQSEFAGKFGIAIKTLRNWEQGISKPEGASLAYLLVIRHDPQHVIRALAAEGPQVIEVHSEPCA